MLTENPIKALVSVKLHPFLPKKLKTVNKRAYKWHVYENDVGLTLCMTLQLRGHHVKMKVDISVEAIPVRSRDRVRRTLQSLIAFGRISFNLDEWFHTR